MLSYNIFNIFVRTFNVLSNKRVIPHFTVPCQEENYLLLTKYVLTCVYWYHPCLSFAHVVNTQFPQSVCLYVYVRTVRGWWSGRGVEQKVNSLEQSVNKRCNTLFCNGFLLYGKRYAIT